MENELLSATLLLDQGADIHELIYKPRGVDVLFKPPYPAREPGIGPTPPGDSVTQWISHYRGGWQVIFPNFGPPVEYKGAPLDMHGEAARVPWELEAVERDEARLQVTLSARLTLSPFSLRRTLSLAGGRPVLELQETIVNEGLDPLECMWGHHPAFGAPLVSPESTLDTGARAVWSDDGYDVAGNDLPLGETWPWPLVRRRDGTAVDLSRLPAPASHLSRVLFLKDFAETWYAITNPRLGFGAGLVWDGSLFPYACLWQETGGVRDYPWYGRAYVTAIEPNSSYPGQGLAAVIRKTGTQMVLGPEESRTLNLKAVFYEGDERVARVDANGEVIRR
jgi:hypothetical protein